MSQREKRKREMVRSDEGSGGEKREKKREKKGGENEKEEGDNVQRERGKEEEKKGEKGGEKKEKRFECGICLELMCWEKEPRILPCCGLSFCSLCLEKLFLVPRQSSSNTPSSSSSSSPSSFPSLLPSSSSSCDGEGRESGLRCPVCRKVNECQSVESLNMNYLIPETIDVLLSSSKMILMSNQSGFHFSLSFFYLLFFDLFFDLLFVFDKLLKELQTEDEVECENFKKCGKRTQMYCPTCETFICDTCDPSHTSSLFNQHHKREQQNRNRDGDGLTIHLECSKHLNELICGYCFKCSVFVCRCCVVEVVHGVHREEVRSLEESVLKRREEVVGVGMRLDNRLKIVEEKEKKVEEQMERLEEKLKRKRAEKKELELEKEDLKIRKDSIIRLSNTPRSSSLFDEQLFSTLLQTASEIVHEGIPLLPEKGIVWSADFHVSPFYFGSGVWGVCTTRDGRILVSEKKNCLRVRDREGNVVEQLERKIRSLPLHLRPVDVAIGLDDQIMVLDSSKENQVVILSKEGEFVRSFGSEGSQEGQFLEPHGLAVDGEGRIFISDTFNHRIQVFNENGSFLFSFGSRGSSEGEFHKPFGIAIDQRKGHVVVSDSWNHRIQVMDREGNFIRCFGTEGSDHSQLSKPKGVDVDGEGRIIVAEWGNRRISVFEEDGTFLFSFGKDQMPGPCGLVIDSFGSVIVSNVNQNFIQLWRPSV